MQTVHVTQNRTLMLFLDVADQWEVVEGVVCVIISNFMPLPFIPGFY